MLRSWLKRRRWKFPGEVPVDMPLSPTLARWLCEHGHDTIHAFEVGLGSASDEEIMEHERSEGRVVVTADLGYPRLLALTRARRPGVVLFRGGNFSESEMLSMIGRGECCSTPRLRFGYD